jgi:hypothetical protein
MLVIIWTSFINQINVKHSFKVEYDLVVFFENIKQIYLFTIEVPNKGKRTPRLLCGYFLQIT